MFTSSDTKHRHRYVEEAVLRTTEVLTHPAVVDSLGRTTVAAQLNILKDMYAPNFRDGIVEIPKRYRNSDATPIIATFAGEVIVAGKGLGLSPTQQERAYQQIKGWKYDGPDSDIEATVAEIHRSHEAKVGQKLYTIPATNLGFATGTFSAHTFTAEKFANIGKNPDRSVNGRSIVGLVMPTDRTQMYLGTPFTMIHEDEHVRQRTETPIKPDFETDKYTDFKFRTELEAYGLAATSERVLFNSDHPEYGGNKDILNNETVDAIRRQHATEKDPYAPRGVIRQMLIETGLDF